LGGVVVLSTCGSTSTVTARLSATPFFPYRKYHTIALRIDKREHAQMRENCPGVREIALPKMALARYNMLLEAFINGDMQQPWGGSSSRRQMSLGLRIAQGVFCAVPLSCWFAGMGLAVFSC
jgi:hypothetical protein